MGYKDPERRKAYDRQHKRAQRAGELVQTWTAILKHTSVLSSNSLPYYT